MNGAALTFSILGKTCTVVLPPTLDEIPAANQQSEPDGEESGEFVRRASGAGPQRVMAASVVKETRGHGERLRDSRRGPGR
jgi:hypothetical protein